MSDDRLPLPHRVTAPDDVALERAQAFREEMARRHTVRDFAPTPVPREILEAAIRAAGSAPSGANHQPWHFSVIGAQDVKRRIRELAEAEERAFYAGKAGEEWLDALKPLGTDAEKPFLEIAPWLVVVWGRRRSPDEHGRMRKNYYVPESVGIATGFLIAALHQSGLATLTHTPNPMSFLNEVCGRPETDKPFLLLVVGHPTPDATVPAHAKRKKQLDEIADFF